MSLVVAIKGKDRIYIGADTICTSGENIYEIKTEENQKIIRVGDILIGYVGSCKHLSCFINNLWWLDTKGKPLTKKFIVKNVIPKLYKELCNMECDDETEDDEKFDGSIIIVKGTDMFLIDGCLSVSKICDFCAVGWSHDFILPIISNSKEGEEEETILKCLRIISENTKSVGKPYLLADTVSMKIRKVEE